MTETQTTPRNRRKRFTTRKGFNPQTTRKALREQEQQERKALALLFRNLNRTQ